MADRPALVLAPWGSGFAVFRLRRGKAKLLGLFAARKLTIKTSELPGTEELEGYAISHDLIYDAVVLLARGAWLDVTEIEGWESREDRDKLRKLQDLHYGEGLESLAPFALIREPVEEEETEEPAEPEPDPNQETLPLGSPG